MLRVLQGNRVIISKWGLRREKSETGKMVCTWCGRGSKGVEVLKREREKKEREHRMGLEEGN